MRGRGCCLSPLEHGERAKSLEAERTLLEPTQGQKINKSYQGHIPHVLLIKMIIDGIVLQETKADGRHPDITDAFDQYVPGYCSG